MKNKATMQSNKTVGIFIFILRLLLWILKKKNPEKQLSKTDMALCGRETSVRYKANYK